MCNILVYIDNEACSKIASNLKRFPAAISKLTAFDYVKPAADDVSLEEMKTLNARATTNAMMDDSDNEVGSAARTKSNDRYTAYKAVRTEQASFIMQYFLLLNRIFICARRNYVSFLLFLVAIIFNSFVVHTYVCMYVYLYVYLYLMEKLKLEHERKQKSY